VISAPQVDESLVPDDVLAEWARIGSPTAFAELVERHREAVYTIVRNLCRTATDTEETLHEAFLTAWRDLRAFHSGVGFSTWLYSIATRTALAYRMRRYHGKRTSNQLGALLPTFDGKGRLIARDSRWPAVEETPAGRIDITAALRDALESIDDLARAALVLCDVLELRPEEAAVILEASPRSVRDYAHQARLLLRGFIDCL
jgi:RNA polymerase sigma-70 factor (ECF subfamily)